MSIRLFALSFTIAVLLACGPVAAQENDQCRQYERVLESELRPEPFDFKRAAKGTFPKVTKAVKENGVEHARAARNGLFQEIGTAPATRLLDSSALQNVVIRRMHFDYCELIWSRQEGSVEERMASLNTVINELKGGQSVAPVQEPPADLALRPVPRKLMGQMQSDRRASLIRPISFSPSLSRMVAQASPNLQPPVHETIEVDPARSARPPAPEGRSDYLRDPPLYVTVYNRWFVIVASPATKEEGFRRLKEIRRKAPQYDFVLYPPYPPNTHYSIMMASWVPKSVAEKALEDAWRYVTPHPNKDKNAAAFLWNCKSLGENC